MIFDGQRYRHSRKVVMLPSYDANGQPLSHVNPDKVQYFYPGRVVEQGKPVPANAVKTFYKWQDTQAPVYAVPVEVEGWGLTNKAYCKDGYTYLCYDAQVYVRSR